MDPLGRVKNWFKGSGFRLEILSLWLVWYFRKELVKGLGARVYGVRVYLKVHGVYHPDSWFRHVTGVIINKYVR